MLFILIAAWGVCAPAGYLAGDVYVHKNKSSLDWMPIACALFPPLGGLVALIVITQVSSEGEDDG